MKVNLLKKRRSITEKEYLRERHIFRWSVVLFIVVVLISIVLFIMQLVVMNKLKRVKGEVEELYKKKTALEEVSREHLYVRERLALINNLLNSRTKSREALETLFSFNVRGIHLSNARISDNNIAVIVQADNTKSLLNAYSYFLNDEFFVYVINNGISMSNGRYDMVLNLGLPRLGGEDAIQEE